MSSIAVVISLFVLIVEVRANTRALEREVLLDRSSRLAEPFLESEELFGAYERVKAVDGWEPLNSAFIDHYGMDSRQAVAWVRYLVSLWQGVEADFGYTGRTAELEGRVAGLLLFPDNRLYWSVAPPYAADFEAFVESVVPGATIRAP
jgi:hypothetical protein